VDTVGFFHLTGVYDSLIDLGVNPVAYHFHLFIGHVIQPHDLVLEAWSARKCPVVSDVGGLSENVTNFIDGVKVYLDPVSIAWGINYVLSDPSRAAAYGRNGRKKVERQFLWSVVAVKMLDVYRKVVM
jgi:glycosyltransferase involved in cell wall biosynthesis